jgi:hypothetical protein
MKGTHPDAEDIIGGQYESLCREARAFAAALAGYGPERTDAGAKVE